MRQLNLSGLFLVCLVLLLGGCQATKPQLSPEAQALKKQLLVDLKELTPQLTGLAAQEDWSAVAPMLQTAYENMSKEAKLVPERIVVLDRNAVTQARFPSPEGRRYDFSNYTPAKIVFTEKRRVQALLYFQGIKIYVVLAPLLQSNDLVGAVALVYPADALERQWHVSEKEFLSINLNQ